MKTIASIIAAACICTAVQAQTTTPTTQQPTTQPVPATQPTPTSPTTTPVSPQQEPVYRPSELTNSPAMPPTGNPSEDTLIRGQQKMRGADTLQDDRRNKKGKMKKNKKMGTSEGTDTTSTKYKREN
ncbi:hypothetical protein DSL64_27605 [Dyadobacter luteus]|uniref:Uncharacterized protein n=1 Tax=Dyadobacter luteus TaxID=2259619 RepID=A0A3D8Y440_9BACT|nr:hypothetical protein [Dyadobacter luteus]REA55967.1 hypothetical protein DSL64_27605 [Dyadobacter luteus]